MYPIPTIALPPAEPLPLSPMTMRTLCVGEVIHRSADRLREAGIEEARRDAVLLLAHVLSTEPWRLLLDPEADLSASQVEELDTLIARRERHEPVAYLIGTREFWSRAFHVAPGVLVPRPETEGLIDAVLARAISGPVLAADIGTGSGCIAVTLAAELPEAYILATDASDEALAIAKRNIEAHGLSDRIELRHESGLEVLGDYEARLDFLVSNPPYVSQAEWEELDQEVRNWEPRGALVPGPSGLEMFRMLCRDAGRLLKPSGWMLLEVGAGQASAVAEMLQEDWRVEIEKDLAGIDRVVAATPRDTREEG